MSNIDNQFRDTSLELKIISYLVRKDHKLCDNLTRDLFSIKAYKLFFDIVKTHRSTFPKDVFKELVVERVKKIELVNPYLLKLFKCKIDNISHKNIIIVSSKLNKLFNLRFAYEKTDEMIESIEKEDVDEVKKIARQIISVGTSKEKVYTGEYLKDYEERKAIIQKRMEKKFVGIPTGIKKFDKISGGVMKGELAIVVGESGMGKSIALENLGLFAWEAGYNVAYFSLEMTKDQIGFRADSRLMRLKYSHFRLGEFTEAQLLKWEKGIQAYRKKKKNYFEIVSMPRGCNGTALENESDRIQDQHGKKLDLILVDYLNIMQPNGSNSGSSRDWPAQVEIAWNLKEIATDFQDEGIAVWTGNQLTDEAEGIGEIKKKHVKYGRGIVEASSIIAGLVQNQDDIFENIIKWQIIKLRDIKDIDPIILRPNFDIMCLNDEYRRDSDGNLSKDAVINQKKSKAKIKVKAL